MVFQNYALYPKMTAEQNIGFGLKMTTTLSKDERTERVEKRRKCSTSRICSTTSPKSYPADNNNESPWACDRPRTGGVPDGRTALEPGRQTPHDDADGDPTATVGTGGHDGVRHPRSDRGDDDGRPDRRPERRSICNRSEPRSNATTTRRTCSSRTSSANHR